MRRSFLVHIYSLNEVFHLDKIFGSIMNDMIREVIAKAKADRVATVDLQFTNLYGGWHHVTLPVSQLTEKIFSEGVAFDGSSIPGFKKQESGDMVLIPDPSTALPDPFWTTKTLSMICSVCEADTHEPYAGDPRSIALKAEQYMREQGIAEQSMWAPEFEFYIFNRVTFANDVNFSRYRIDSEEADWNSGLDEEGNLGYKIGRKSGYHATPPMDRMFELRSLMVKRIEEAGIPVRYHHHEVGGPGQSEIEIMPGPMSSIGDITQRIKYIIKMTAYQAGKSVTFMPKPLYNEAGSGMHFHQCLWKGKTNLFYSEKSYAGLSEMANSYIAGMLEHGAALVAITNPSTNSYKRLVPGFEAPVRAFYSLGNRSAAIRIPKYAISHDEKRMEFRPPDATTNIYLALAAQLMSGIDGIQKKFDPTKMGFGPFDVDVMKLSKDEQDKIRQLPTSLREACNALEKDHEFLKIGKVFPANFVDTWIKKKGEEEYNAVRRRPHPYEIELYYDV
jgi:glutamine synthetase